MSADLAYQSPNLAPEVKTRLEKLQETVKDKFKSEYQNWYTEAAAVIEQVIPSRLAEFISYYEPEKNRRSVDILSYSLRDWLLDLRAMDDGRGGKNFNDSFVAYEKFRAQLAILEAANRRFESSLFDIKQLARADLFDSELDAASELLKHRFHRAAGAVAGVVLEKHLGAVCEVRKIALKKNHPTISTFNDALKEAGVIDVATWRFVQHLGDIRNSCDHGKVKEPTDADVEDLIAGVRKISKTIY